MRKFDISTPQASADIALFLKNNPEIMVYCGTAKAYILNAVALNPSTPPSGEAK